MRPAFASLRQAIAFALLLLFILLSPVLVGKSLLVSRSQFYSSIWWERGPFTYIHQQIFQEKGDIDIVFVGSSHILHAIDTPYVQEKLSETLGRPAVVRSICWNGSGFDKLYFITRDLLENRKVHMMVFYNEYTHVDYENSLTLHLFRWADDSELLAGQSLPTQMCFYFGAVIGMPRNLLGLIRNNIPGDFISDEKNSIEGVYQAPNPALTLGTISSRRGFGYGRVPTDENAPFVDFNPPQGTLAQDVSIYSSATQSKFQFAHTVPPPLLLYFARKFATQAQDHGTRLVLLHIPVVSEARDPLIREDEFWPDTLQASPTMMGISSGELFATMSDADIHKLFYDADHLNKNGQQYFTDIITPTLLQIYLSQLTH